MEKKTLTKEKDPNKKKSNLGFKVIFMALVLLGAAAYVVVNFSDIFVNLLFFSEVGQLDVYLKELTTMIKLVVPLFIVYYMLYAFTIKALYMKVRRENEVKVAMSSFMQKNFHRFFAILIALPLSFYSASSLWMKLLEFMGKTPFGQSDPIFGKDIAFYVFDLPLFRQLLIIFAMNVALLFAMTFFASLFTFIKDYQTADEHKGRDKFEMEENRFAKLLSQSTKNMLSHVLPMFGGAFKRNFLMLFAMVFLALAGWVYISRFDFLYGSHTLGYGAYFTDVNIKIPVLTVIALLLVVGAVVMVMNLFVKVRLTGLLAAVIALGYFGMIATGYTYQNYVVEPNEYSKEKTYIEYNIAATQHAYGLDEIEVRDFAAEETLDAQDIYDNLATIENIPINDYQPTLDTYNSTQGIRPYYRFADVDTDRYIINGQYTQMFLSGRELSTTNLDPGAQNWINMHLKYTHGFGVAASRVNEVTSTGQPVLSLKDIPTYATVSGMNITEPRIYYGELTNDYAVVNTASLEFDYPEGSSNKENAYTGTGGIPLTTANKVLFSINKGTLKFLLSSDITSQSKILIHRNILDRVKTIAPFLRYDNDPYLVISEGKLYYIIDAMTTSSNYPYSQRFSKEETFNYIRNSVKVVVDAYNGDVTFYKMGDDDPILNAYASIYPTLFEPIEEMSPDLRSHLRYSEDYFNIQAHIYQTYHMSDAQVFYNKEDSWKIATQFYQGSKDPARVNSAYMIMKLPDRDKEEFMLMLPFTPNGKTNMISWMSGICDGEDYGKLLLYQMPKQKLVYGPLQIEQRVDQDTIIAPQLALLSQQGATVLRGNMYTIPIGDSLLYVEPVYVTATNVDAALPEVKKVIVACGDEIVMKDSLAEALNELFGTKLSAPTASAPESGSTATPPTPPAADLPDDIKAMDQSQLIAKANDLFENAQSAQKDGDWSKYGEYMEELQKVLQRLEELSTKTQ